MSTDSFNREFGGELIRTNPSLMVKDLRCNDQLIGTGARYEVLKASVYGLF